jgi:hypothetical protein
MPRTRQQTQARQQLLLRFRQPQQFGLGPRQLVGRLDTR